MTAIAFNQDGSQVVVCPGTKELFLFNTNGSTEESKWTEIQLLNEHSMEAYAIDWNHERNMIVSGSVDWSVFVWNFDTTKQKFGPQFVSLDEKLSIIDIKWARNGKKFVAGTSSKWIYVAWEDAALKA